MARMIVGERVGRRGRVSLATSAVIFDESERVLLTQRRDTGLWCLPGGIVEPGETVSEAVTRETREETGLVVTPVHLVGVYSDPDLLVGYPDGTQHHPVVLCFRCTIQAGTPALSPETTDIGFFEPDALPPIVPAHRQRLADARTGAAAAFIR